MSSADPLTCNDASCLTSCHPGFVSLSCHFFRTRRTAREDATSHRLSWIRWRRTAGLQRRRLRGVAEAGRGQCDGGRGQRDAPADVADALEIVRPSVQEVQLDALRVFAYNAARLQ